MMERDLAFRLHGELARRGLLGVQLTPYDDPDVGWVDPKADPDMIANAYEFCRLVDQMTKARIVSELAGMKAPSAEEAG